LAAPTFSVVITTYNRANLLPRAVASVLAQTCTDFELIVVDDGSTDATTEVLERLARDPRVQTLRIANSGVAHARNVGIAAGSGEWIALLDDDDQWRATYLEHQLARAAASRDADVVYCSAEEYNREGELARVWPGAVQPVDAFSALVGTWYLWPSATVIRRRRFVAVGGFDPTLPVGEDKDLFLRLALHTEFAGIEAPLVDLGVGGHPRQTDRTLDRTRVAYALDRRWRPTIIRRCGRAVYAEYFHREVARRTIRAMLLAPAEDQRAVAATALRLLASRLPRSATTIPFPLLMLTLGPARYQWLRANYRRIPRALTARPRAARASDE
jgi:glycosyltransferase involved in cell wall biosynthesis